MPTARKPKTTSQPFSAAEIAAAKAAALPSSGDAPTVDWSRALVTHGGGVAATVGEFRRRTRRPNKNPTKEQVAIRVDKDVLEAFRANGSGWQTRMTVLDVPLLDLWDRQPHVIAATSDDPSQTKAFGDTDWREELSLAAPANQYFIGELNGRPIGAMQIIDPDTEATHYWGDIEPNLRAIDIWIGMAEDLGKGYMQARRGQINALNAFLRTRRWIQGKGA